jgi:hypothetical protein
MGYRNYSVANGYLVDKAGNGDFTTIGAALTAASSASYIGDIFIRPGTYTENPTLIAGVNLVAWSADSLNPTVTISGTVTASYSGTASLQGINLSNNGATNCVAISGSNATILNLLECNITSSSAAATAESAIYSTTSSSSSVVNIIRCSGSPTGTSVRFITNDGAGTFNVKYCEFTNPSNLAADTLLAGSTGAINAYFCRFFSIVTTSGTAAVINLNHCYINTSGVPSSAVSHNSTSATASTLAFCELISGSSTPVTVGASATLTMTECECNTSSATVVSGSGTLNYSPINFSGSGAPPALTVTTRTPLNYGTWTPTVIGASTAGTTTYSVQEGLYTIIGNLVYIEATITISAATGTGNALFNLPFTVKNLSNYNPQGTMNLSSTNWAWTGATGTMLTFGPLTNTATAEVNSLKSDGAATLAMTNGAATFAFSCWYQI